MRRINDALGRFYSTLVYVYIFVCNAWKRSSHSHCNGKDRHIHMRIYACAHGHAGEWRLLALERRRRLARERECYRIFQVGVEGEGFCCSLYKQPLMNKITMGVTNVSSDSLKQPGCLCTCNKCLSQKCVKQGH